MSHRKSNRSKGVGQHANGGIVHDHTVNDHNNRAREFRDPSPSDSIQSQNPEIMHGSTLDYESQGMLATQFPVKSPPRPSSAGSIQPQAASIKESSTEPHEELSAQALPQEPNGSIPNISAFKYAISDVSNKGRALLQHLQAGKKDSTQEKKPLHQGRAPTTRTNRGLPIDVLLNPEGGPEIPSDIASNGIAAPIPPTLTTSSRQQFGLSTPSQPRPTPHPSHQEKRPAIEERPRPVHHNVASVPPVTSDPTIPAKANIKTNTTEPTESKRKRDRSESDHPWTGMRKIRRRDVRIPKDQEALFNNGDSWIPADVGHPTPQGHVPPTLLQEWNVRMTRNKETIVSPKRSQATPEQEVYVSPFPSQFVPQLDDESESDPESQASWSTSPPDHSRRLAVPPDSSPVGQPRFPITAGFDDQNQNKATEMDAVNINGNKDCSERVSQIPPKANTIDGVQETNNVDEDGHAENKDSSMDDSPVKDKKLKKYERKNVVEDETSDDSDMETSIPRALDASAQEDIVSQVESHGIRDSTFSASSLAPIDKIQIQNTQLAGFDHSTKSNFIQPSTAAQSSSDGNKLSSQVIANSVDSKGKRFIDHENGLETANGSLVVDSQNMNSDEPHSSIPSHQDSQQISEMVPSSSLFSIGIQTQDYLEFDGTRNKTTQSGSMGSAVVTPAIILKRDAEHLESDEESPLKRVVKRVMTDLNIIRTQQSPISSAIKQKILDDKHRRTFDVTPDGAPRVFEMFKKAYPAYPGDFLHFKNLCCKLHLLRRVGLLRNYFFWDDFIMKHIGNYGTYVQNCVSVGRHWDDYEDYFCSNFITKPSFKKRSLVPHTLDAVISESDIRPTNAPMVDMETQVDMDCVTDPRVASIKPRMVNVGVQASMVSQDMVAGYSGAPSGYGNSIQKDEPHQLGSTKRKCATAMKNSNITEFPGASEVHEMASPELRGDPLRGNDTRHSHKATASLITRMQKEDRHAIRTLIRNKQRPQHSLDELRHDADTPFRTWARADQNVVSERRRRGGWQVPCDENGNIEFEEYPRTGCENGRQSWGWAWRPSADYS
ncbi:hypothetical protein PISL3812_07068 [Talaromyces islandicus]|uniref:Uncharacterized protein n=1 Tax=Talaromyces islandicus TaxID=28573 RepID=A0A0U1M380_TALIS|nr:hypothetical protein PISL3812_07068 [Talaromyces islandicus]